MSDPPLSLDALRAMTPDEAAARWIAREDPDAALFAQWLAESDANRAAWGKAQLVWRVFDEAEQDAMVAAMARAARAARSETAPSAMPTPANDRAWPRRLAAAGAVCMVATTVVLGLHGDWFSGAAPPKAAFAADPLSQFGRPDYLTGKGQSSIATLPDGTRVTLGPESALDLAFVGGRRDLRLVRGHGYFDVAHDRMHPFSVAAAGRLVTALGTRFDVAVTPGAIRIALAQGSVSIASAAGSRAVQPPVRLRPGEVFVATGDAPGKVGTDERGQNGSSREAFAAFDDRPLAEVVEQLNRSTRAQIFIRDPAVAAMRVTGQFRTGDIERFSRALTLVLPVRTVARGPDRYEIVRRR